MNENIKERVALVTGVTGQDGSYLTELLLSEGYTVHGVVRRSSVRQHPRLDHLSSESNHQSRLHLHFADLEDTTTIRRILLNCEPDEVYHLAGQSHVGLSFEVPESTCSFTAMGTLRLLEIIRDLPKTPRLLHIGSSEIFGRPSVTPQNESTPMAPVTPYGVAKAFAVQMIRVYRESFGIHACNAICFNHESPRRGETFVTRKITRAVARIHCGLQKELSLGNLDARRDWGFAGDYVVAMWQMLQCDNPDDYVIATGRSASIRDFLELAFGVVGLRWKDHVVVDPKFFRPADSHDLVGDASKAKAVLDWSPSVDLEQLVRLMVESDLETIRNAQSKSDNFVS